MTRVLVSFVVAVWMLGFTVWVRAQGGPGDPGDFPCEQKHTEKAHSVAQTYNQMKSKHVVRADWTYLLECNPENPEHEEIFCEWCMSSRLRGIRYAGTAPITHWTQSWLGLPAQLLCGDPPKSESNFDEGDLIAALNAGSTHMRHEIRVFNGDCEDIDSLTPVYTCFFEIEISYP